MEEEMAEKPGKVQSIGMQRVEHKWTDLAHDNKK